MENAEIFEKVNPMHPDKIADRIAGALVDLAYKKESDPKCAIEVLLGHEECNILGECSAVFLQKEIEDIVERITKNAIQKINIKITKQDKFLAKNQKDKIRCGDNGIFKACLPTYTERAFTELMQSIFSKFPTDGKGIITRYYNQKKEIETKVIICQSQASNKEIEAVVRNWLDSSGFVFNENNSSFKCQINPLGYWIGGLSVDSGATNRKLGSDMGRSATGGGLIGKDISKADLTINTFLHLQASKRRILGYTSFCAIGDEAVKATDFEGNVDVFDFEYMAKYVKDYIKRIGGFEKFAEWGLIRPRIQRLAIKEEEQEYERTQEKTEDYEAYI